MALTSNQVETLLTPAEIPVKSPGGVYTASFSQTLANLGTSATTPIAWTPGHRFKILSVIARTAVAGTGSGASQVFTTKIGTAALTGGVLTLNLANQQTTYGQNVFTAGQVDLLFKVQNLDG